MALRTHPNGCGRKAILLFRRPHIDSIESLILCHRTPPIRVEFLFLLKLLKLPKICIDMHTKLFSGGEN